MNRNMMAVLLALFLIFGLAGCTSEKKADTENTPQATTSISDNAEGSAEESTSAPDVAAEMEVVEE